VYGIAIVLCYTPFLLLDIDIRTPSFTGDSYLTFELLSNASITTTIDIAVRPNSSEGLIIYFLQSMEDNAPYLSLSLEEGIPVFRYDSGSGLVEIRGDFRIDDDEWHIISISQDREHGELLVDNMDAYTGLLQGSFSGLMLNGGLLYIGGVSDFSLIDPPLPEGSGFIGCVAELQVNRQMLQLLEDSVEALAIGQCQSSACSYVQCLNGGTCVDQAMYSFMCQCAEGFAGQNCEMSNFTCAPDMCLFGGNCLERGNNFICQCPLGRNGRLCEEGIIIILYVRIFMLHP